VIAITRTVILHIRSPHTSSSVQLPALMELFSIERIENAFHAQPEHTTMCWGGPPALSVIFVNQAAIQLQEARNALTAVRDLILQNLERQNVIYVQWGDIRWMQQMTNVVSAIAEVTHQG
jgi:hypothetical protein